MTEKERIQSIKTNGGRHLQNFKRENITYAMCLEAVRSTGQALGFVPDEFRSYEIYLEACHSYGPALLLVPRERRTNEICKAAIVSNGIALEYVPEKLKTPELCRIAVTEDTSAYRYCPESVITPEFCNEIAIAKGADSIRDIPKAYRTEEFYADLVKMNPEIIKSIPKGSRSAAVSKAALRGFGYGSLAEAVKDAPSIMGLVHGSLYDNESALLFVKSKIFYDNVHIEPGRGLLGDISDSGVVTWNCYSFNLKRILKWDDVCRVAVQFI